MFGPKITTVFASRWRAIWWAAGMIATAVSLVPSRDDTDANGNGPAPASPAAHHNPWSKD
jgi:hypothetical protein